MTPEAFWAKVEKTDNCWLWTGSLDHWGYGILRWDIYATKKKAHRVAWELTNGPIPDGMHVFHTCGRRHCVRPSHHFASHGKIVAPTMEALNMLGHIKVSDINEALPHALPLLRQYGVEHTAASLSNPRATIEWPGLFVTEYWKPQRNVLFDPVRDANPMFHYLESMWILAGRNDVKFLAHVLPRIADYSDEGRIFHGAYGYRMRQHFGFDQIEETVTLLKQTPSTRQAVISIWDANADLGAKTKDMPCNDLIMFKVRRDHLNITVCNRSNDAIWGCYGANAVQFSMLLMYCAARLGVQVGTYCQISDSFHVYADNPYWQWYLDQWKKEGEYWSKPLTESRELYANIGDQNLFEHNIHLVDDELETFFLEADHAISKGGSDIPLFANSTAVRIAINMFNVLYFHRAKQPDKARTEAWSIEVPDWREAAQRWLTRRTK